MTALRARKPTGNVAWPLVLVEGPEKSGKSYVSFSLSASEKVGRTFVFDFGEGAADEYAALGRYEVVDHDGTYTDFIGQLAAAMAEPSDPDRPNVIVIDSGTILWELLKNWASARARRSKTNKALLAQDPDAEINVSSTYWNDANDRWGRMVHMFRTWNGIGVIICRAKEVSKMGRDGNPVAGQTEYRVEGQKMLPYNVSAQIRCHGPRRASLVAVRSLAVEVPPAGMDLPEQAPLERVVFDILGAGAPFGLSSAVEGQIGRPVAAAKNELVDVFVRAGFDPENARTLASEAWLASACCDLTASDDVSDAQWAELMAAATVTIGEQEHAA